MFGASGSTKWKYLGVDHFPENMDFLKWRKETFDNIDIEKRELREKEQRYKKKRNLVK